MRGLSPDESGRIRRGKQRKRDAGHRDEQADENAQTKECGLRSGFLFHLEDVGGWKVSVERGS